MSRRPVNQPYTITTEFGVPDSYAKFGRHSGVDYGVPGGRPVYAPANGSLQNVVSPTGGNMVVIFDGQFYHRLMHNQAFSRGNGSVNEGDQVALVDSTGLSTGNHCHWDINSEGVYPTSFAAFKDPYQWLQGAYKPAAPPAPPALAANQRLLSNPTGVNQRAAPNTSAAIIKEWPYDQDPFTFKGYVLGEAVNGNNVWFVGGLSGGYFYSGAFQGGANTTGLPNLTAAPAPPPPTPTPPPADNYPSFTKDVACVTEVTPAYKGNYEVGNFPSKPTGVVLHDFGTDGVDTYSGTVAHFRNPGVEVSAHFVVSGKKITQMVSLSNRAWHAGPQGNDKIGIECDPDVDTNMDTKNSVITLLSQLDARNAVLTRYLHSQFMATACGDDIQKANLLIPPAAPTEPSDLEKRVTVLENIVKYIQDFLASIFSGFKKQ